MKKSYAVKERNIGNGKEFQKTTAQQTEVYLFISCYRPWKTTVSFYLIWHQSPFSWLYISDCQLSKVPKWRQMLSQQNTYLNNSLGIVFKFDFFRDCTLCMKHHLPSAILIFFNFAPLLVIVIKDSVFCEIQSFRSCLNIVHKTSVKLKQLVFFRQGATIIFFIMI